ncbi:unnamed protein product [Pedinophyceae sp. YPF-701]|nr:unnamed protein product [Pedinophyceae sp. YPF-701]
MENGTRGVQPPPGGTEAQELATGDQARVKYAVVARSSDGLVLSSWAARGETTSGLSDQRTKLVSAILQKLAEQRSARQRPPRHASFPHRTNPAFGTVHVTSNSDYAVAVVTSQDYPRHVAQQMITQIQSSVDTVPIQPLIAQARRPGELATQCYPRLRQVCIQYSDLELMQQAQSVAARVRDVKVVMEGNIDRVVSNIQRLEDVDSRAQTARVDVQDFLVQARDTQQRAWYTRTKVWIIVALVVVLLLAGIIPAAVLAR